MENNVEQNGKQKKSIWKSVVLGMAFLIISYGGLLAFTQAGGMHYTALASRKIQHMQMGQKRTFGDPYCIGEEMSILGELTEGISASQRFYITDEMLKCEKIGVAVYVGNFGRQNSGTFQIELSQGETTEIVSYDMSAIKKDSYLKIVVNTEELSAGEAFVNCVSDGQQGSSLALVLTDQDIYDDACYMNQEKIENKNFKMMVYAPF